MEKPILFNTEMVKAILEGRKTQTRRIIKSQPKNEYPIGFITSSTDSKREGCYGWSNQKDGLGGILDIAKPPYKIGDILYVRETWCELQELDGNENFIENTERYYYRAGDWPECDRYLKPNGSYSENIPWKPSIHMPKEAARIFLKVANIRAERLQDITEGGAKAEGTIYPIVDTGNNVLKDGYRLRFSDIWNSIYKNWDENPWVWVIEFEKINSYKI